MAGGLRRTVTIHHQQAPVVRRQTQHQFFSHGIIRREYRTDQTALAPPGPGHRFAQVAIGQERRDWAEGLHGMHHLRTRGINAAQQHGRHERAQRALTGGTTFCLYIAGDHLRFGAQRLQGRQYIRPLRQRRQRTHTHARVSRVANRDRRQTRRNCRGDRFRQRLRDDDFANGGTFLPRLRCHLAHHLAH